MTHWYVFVSSAAGSYCAGVRASRKEAEDLAAWHRRSTPWVRAEVLPG